MSKLSKIANSGPIIGDRCFFFGYVPAKVMRFPLDFYCGFEFAATKQLNALVASFVICALATIGSILRYGPGAKIVISVIEAVAVSMIYRWGSKVIRYEAVHSHALFPAIYDYLTHGVPPTAFAIKFGSPVELIYKFVSMGTHQSIFALGQGDDAIGWVKRLLNRMANHASFHGLSVTEIVGRVAALDYFHFNRMEAI